MRSWDCGGGGCIGTHELRFVHPVDGGCLPAWSEPQGAPRVELGHDIALADAVVAGVVDLVGQGVFQGRPRLTNHWRSFPPCVPSRGQRLVPRDGVSPVGVAPPVRRRVIRSVMARWTTASDRPGRLRRQVRRRWNIGLPGVRSTVHRRGSGSGWRWTVSRSMPRPAACPNEIAGRRRTVWCPPPPGRAPYLTPPAVSPAMMRRWKTSTAMTSGTVTRTPAAICVPYGWSKR